MTPEEKKVRYKEQRRIRAAKRYDRYYREIIPVWERDMVQVEYNRVQLLRLPAEKFARITGQIITGDRLLNP